MNTEEIRAQASAAAALPEGHAKAQRLETLAAQAKENGDPLLEAQVLLALSYAHEYGAERDKLPVVFGRLLQLLDRHPGPVGQLSHSIHWQLKWMTSALLGNPDVPLAVGERWLAELERRYRQQGYTLRAVHAERAMLAVDTGDFALASAQMEASIAAARDQMSNCHACERNGWGHWRAALGDDEGALAYWAPVIDGTIRCNEEPHRVLSMALLPLLRTGRTDEARGAFLRGYSISKGNISLLATIGRHIEFCALTGNEARGLEILAEHQAWLTDRQVTTRQRLDFIGGVLVLLRRLAALGHDDLPLGTSQTVAAVAAGLEEEISALCARYDARNGSSVLSADVAARLGREPLLAELPLGLPSRLPGTATPDPSTPGPATPHPAAAGAGLDELIARALDLTQRRHPGAGSAWERVAAAAGGRDLPAGIDARVTRARAGTLLRTDPAAARPVLLDAARRFADCGDLDGELEALATAAFARRLAGSAPLPRAETAPRAETELAAETGPEIGAVRDRAAAAFAAGELSVRYYLNVLVSEQLIAGRSLEGAAERDPAEQERFAAGLRAVLALAEQHGDAYHIGQCQHMLAGAADGRGDRDAMAAHLGAAREAFLAAGAPWAAAHPEAVLAQLALMNKDPGQAEAYARDALAHAVDLPPAEAARLATLRAAALGELPDRTAEFAEASLLAAARWDGISEPDTLHNTFGAARAYARLGRHAEAAALFAEAMPKVDVPYDQTGIAQTRDLYARSLRAINQHREAAEQFLEAARLIADDPANATAHAMVAAEAARELELSGQPDAALAAFRRAAELFAGLGDTVGRVRCLRSAAWLQFEHGEDGGRSGIATMRSVLAEVRSPADGQLAAELEPTEKQLDSMLKSAAERGDAVN